MAHRWVPARHLRYTGAQQGRPTHNKFHETTPDKRLPDKDRPRVKRVFTNRCSQTLVTRLTLETHVQRVLSWYTCSPWDHFGFEVLALHDRSCACPAVARHCWQSCLCCSAEQGRATKVARHVESAFGSSLDLDRVSQTSTGNVWSFAMLQSKASVRAADKKDGGIVAT